MAKYIKVKKNSARITHLKIEFYYKQGGISYLTHKNEPRGYYVSVLPMGCYESGGYTIECTTVLSGIKQCIKEVTRKNKKAEDEAKKMAENVVENLIQHILNKNNLVLAN